MLQGGLFRRASWRAAWSQQSFFHVWTNPHFVGVVKVSGRNTYLHSNNPLAQRWSSTGADHADSDSNENKNVDGAKGLSQQRNTLEELVREEEEDSCESVSETDSDAVFEPIEGRKSQGVRALSSDSDDTEGNFTDEDTENFVLADGFDPNLPVDFDGKIPKNFDWLEFGATEDTNMDVSRRKLKKARKAAGETSTQEADDDEIVTEPQDEEEIKQFLAHFSMESHSELFLSWKHLCDCKSLELRKLGIPIKDRKLILRWVERWKEADRRRAAIYQVEQMWTPPTLVERQYAPRTGLNPTNHWPY
jgi:hypothetical protein